MTPSMDATSTPQWSTFNEDPADFSYLRATPLESSGSRGLRDEEVSYPRPPDDASKSSIMESDASIQEDYDDLLAKSSRSEGGSKKDAADDFEVLSDFGVRIIDELVPPNDMIFVEKLRTPKNDPLLELVKKRVVSGDPDDLTYLRTSVAKPRPLLESAPFPNASATSNSRLVVPGKSLAGNVRRNVNESILISGEPSPARRTTFVNKKIGAEDRAKKWKPTKNTVAEKTTNVLKNISSRKPPDRIDPRRRGLPTNISDWNISDVSNKKAQSQGVSRGKTVPKDVLEDDTSDFKDDYDPDWTPGSTGAILERSEPANEDRGQKRGVTKAINKQFFLVTTGGLFGTAILYAIIQSSFFAGPLKDTAAKSERPQEGIGLKRSWFSVNKSNHEATEYEESSSTSVDEVYSYFHCSTAACRWQRRVMDTKLNLNVDPCEDFYSYVCSESWESDGELPYRAAGHAYIIMKVTQFLREHEHAVRHNRSRGRLNFLDHASLFLTSCLSDANLGGLAQWDQIRALLRDVGLDDWPYLVPPPPPFHLDDVLKLVGRQLAIFPFVHVALRKRAESGDYIPHLDAPRNFLFVRYEMQKDAKSSPYREVIRRVLILWKSIRKSNTLTQEIVELEEDLFDASRPPRKQVWSRDMIVPVTQIPMLPRLRLDVYIWHLRQEAREVAILNPSYFSRLSTVLRKPTPRTFLNFIGVWVVIMASPFLPKNSLPRELAQMNHPDHKTYLDSRHQTCFHLAEKLFPHGVRWILRTIVRETGDLDRQWNVLIRDMVSAMVHSFREGTAWMKSADISSTVKRLKSLRVDFLGGREPLEDIASYYPKADVSFEPTTALKDYTYLLNSSLAKYWASQSGSDYDARHSDRSFGMDIAWERSPEAPGTLYMSSSSVASASLVTKKSVSPTLIPLMAANLARALFISSLEESNWSDWIKDNFRRIEICLLNRLNKTLGAASSNAKDFLFVTLTDNAIMKPLITAFRRVGSEEEIVPGMWRSNLTPWRYFFINYAADFCVPKAEDRRALDRMRLRISLPAKSRVNSAVLGLRDFQRAFSCPGRLLTSSCPIWADRDVAS
ncbi:hypothetical protein ISCGN_024736 [Ixodes scapularis]